MVRVSYWLEFYNYNSCPFKLAYSCKFFYNTSSTSSFSVMANQNVIKMLFIFQANAFNRNSWFSKSFNENKTKGIKTLLISIGGEKSPSHTKNEVSKRWCSSTTSLEF
jgi:hypothetical protein